MKESEIYTLQIKNKLSVEFHKAIEKCLLEKLPIKKALGKILPIICQIIGADEILVRTIDESMELVSLKTKNFLSVWSYLVPWKIPEKKFESKVFDLENCHLILASLDVVDQVIGLCGVAFCGEFTSEQIQTKIELVDSASKLLNNYLEGIASNARKQSITMFSAKSLRNPIFEEGADKAVKHLCCELDIEEFILVYGDFDTPIGQNLHYRYYNHGSMIHNSIDLPDDKFKKILKNIENVLDLEDKSFTHLLGTEGVIEKPLQNGMSKNLIGKLVLKPKEGRLNPESLDILQIFSECLGQRLFDYNKERRYLAKCFCIQDVQRLLGEPDFYNKYLSPRKENIVILYADIASFTMICEKVLTSSSEIGELINKWSQKILKILFKYNGVFDKMAGDCVIGLFGPPFFESTMEKRVINAISAAKEIIDETIALGKSLGIENKIIEKSIAKHLTTSNGIHCGPTSVGFFGTKGNYTGVSSAMRITARLQDHAAAGQILVSSEILSCLNEGRKELAHDLKDIAEFEGPHEISVKNVSEPLEYFHCVFN